jgi:ribosomal protein S18 acetylase RimI-like enzyme
MPKPAVLVPVNTTEEIAEVSSLANEIWRDYYVPVIGLAQVEYMLGKFQSPAAIVAQRLEGYEYYFVRSPADGSHGGYIALQAQAEGLLFISKFYLQRAVRGTGLGRTTMTAIEHLARARGLSCLWLTVNKGNAAVQVYERLGFRKTRELVVDIGAGFVMDDFRMEKAL